MNGANLSLKDNFMVKAVLLVILAIIAFYLLTQHGMHLLAYSSYILILGFILLHMFMCGGHGKHGGHGNHGEYEKNGEHGGHGGRCGERYDHGRHKHKKADQEDPQNAGEHEDMHKHEHNQEKLT